MYCTFDEHYKCTFDKKINKFLYRGTCYKLLKVSSVKKGVINYLSSNLQLFVENINSKYFTAVLFEVLLSRF